MMEKNVTTTAVDLSHHIQRAIIIQLRQRGTASYQALKPDGVEGNAFNYHLRILKKAKLLKQTDEGYGLTHVGHLVSDAFSYDSQRLMLRPNVYTTLLITQDNYVLVYAPVRQPTAGWLCLPSGKVHYGDSFEESIRREVYRRDLSDDYETSLLCATNIRYLRDGEMVVQRPGMIWHVAYKGVLRDRQTDSGRTFWKSKAELLASPDALPDIKHALARLETRTYNSIDLEWSLDR